MLRKCAYAPCGRMFETGNVRRLFCCERCRRSDQNAARREARAEVRARRESDGVMADPWDSPMQEDGDIWSNALLDALPAGMEKTVLREAGKAADGAPKRADRASSGAPTGVSAARRRPSASGSCQGRMSGGEAGTRRNAASSAPGFGNVSGNGGGNGSGVEGPRFGKASGAASERRQLFPSA